MGKNPFFNQAQGSSPAETGHNQNSGRTNFRKKSILKTRTKLLGIFVLMFAGLFYANTVIFEQSRINNSFIESQNNIMANQATLSDAISCFGAIKYWFAILDNGLKKSPVELPSAAEKKMKCDLSQFGSYLKNLKTFSNEATEVEKKYERMRDLPKDAMTAYIEGEVERGQAAMSQAYGLISEIDGGLGKIAKKLNDDSADLAARAFAQSEEFKKFPILFSFFGALGIALVSVIIFFNIFRPIEKIISVMMDASQDPHNTQKYIVYREDGGDEIGNVVLALNSLLAQVHEGFRRTEEAEQEIAATARRLDAIFNSVADGLITVNAEGEIESLNKSAYGIFGYDQKTVKGKKIGDFFPPAASLIYMLGIHDFISGSGGGDLVGSGPQEMMGSRSDGGNIPIELSVTDIPMDDGHPIFVNVVRDITYRKDLERQLLQAQKMEALGSLSSGIAHEINSPTQYVRDNIKFLQDAFRAYEGFYKAIGHFKDALPQEQTAFKEEIAKAEKKQDIAFFSEEAQQALSQSLEGVERISEIVGAIKGFSYPATEEFIHVDLNELLKNTIIVSRNQWKAFAQLRTDFDANLPQVLCIPGQLTQVILNLIVNAVHAIEEKNKGTEDPQNNFIALSTSATAKKVTIKITDSGCGIPKENMSKIFNPFFTTKEVGKGTGQGLSISYDIIVKKHGGTLSTESEPGKGATFIIELPMEAESIKAASKNKKGKA